MLPFESADIRSSRIFHELQDTEDPQKICDLSKQYAQLAIRDGRGSLEAQIVNKVLSIADTDPLLALTTLEEIADFSNPVEQDSLNQGSALSVKATYGWNLLFQDRLNKDKSKVPSLLTAFETFRGAKAPHLKDVAGQAVITSVQQLHLPFTQAHDFVTSVRDHAKLTDNHFLQIESARALKALERN